MRRVLYTILLLLLTLPALAQIKGHRGGVPPWVNGELPSKRGMQGRWYKIMAEGETLDVARENAHNLLIKQLTYAKGVHVDLDAKSHTLSDHATRNAKSDYRERERTEDNTGLKASNDLNYEVVDEYYDKALWGLSSSAIYVLYWVPAKPEVLPPDFNYSVVQKGGGGWWKSFLFPGLGQFSQGRTGMGILFVSGFPLGFICFLIGANVESDLLYGAGLALFPITYAGSIVDAFLYKSRVGSKPILGCQYAWDGGSMSLRPYLALQPSQQPALAPTDVGLTMRVTF